MILLVGSVYPLQPDVLNPFNYLLSIPRKSLLTEKSLPELWLTWYNLFCFVWDSISLCSSWLRSCALPTLVLGLRMPATTPGLGADSHSNLIPLVSVPVGWRWFEFLFRDITPGQCGPLSSCLFPLLVPHTQAPFVLGQKQNKTETHVPGRRGALSLVPENCRWTENPLPLLCDLYIGRDHAQSFQVALRVSSTACHWEGSAVTSWADPKLRDSPEAFLFSTDTGSMATASLPRWVCASVGGQSMRNWVTFNFQMQTHTFLSQLPNSTWDFFLLTISLYLLFGLY